MFPKLVRTVTQVKAAIVLLSTNKKFFHFMSKIFFAVIAHNTEQQSGFGSALPLEESHITPSLGTTAVVVSSQYQVTFK